MGRIAIRLAQLSAEDFRRPMAVLRTRAFPNGECYPICPQCNMTLEREYQMFCDRCGQRLLWRRR